MLILTSDIQTYVYKVIASFAWTLWMINEFEK